MPSSEDLDDAELLEAWRGGNVDAGDELLRRHFVAVYRFFAANLGGPDRAADPDDLTQRTFEACIQTRDRVQTDFRGYLFGIARRQLYGEWKKRRAIGDMLRPSQANVRDVRTSPSAAVARLDDQMLVMHAIESLPLEFKAVIERFYWEERSIADIAKELGVAKGTVKSRLHRGKAMLREELAAARASAALRDSVIERLEQRSATDADAD